MRKDAVLVIYWEHLPLLGLPRRCKLQPNPAIHHQRDPSLQHTQKMSTTTTEELPVVPEGVTPEWLGAKIGHKIKSLECTRKIMGTGSKLFYTITYEDGNDADESRPKHVCVKGVFSPEMVEQQPWTASLAQREADFFSRIAPSIQGRMLFPKSWWSGTSEKQGIAVMTDLVAHEGCTFAPEVANYSVEKVKNGVEQLAGLHAQYWGQSQEDHPCKTIPIPASVFFTGAFLPVAGAAAPLITVWRRILV